MAASDAAIASNEAQLRALIEEQTRAISARDIEGIMRLYLDDAVIFDAIPPFRMLKISELRSGWENCFPYMPESFGVEQREVTIHATAETGFAHWLFRFTGPAEHPATQNFLRWTACYRKVGGAWGIAHEHISVPFDPLEVKPILTLEPEKVGPIM